MGCMTSKELRTNLRSDDPNQVIGSTMLRADQIVVLGDSVFLPTKNADGEDLYLKYLSTIKKSKSIVDTETNSYEVVSLREQKS
jgi:hypothetical protein